MIDYLIGWLAYLGLFVAIVFTLERPKRGNDAPAAPAPQAPASRRSSRYDSARARLG